MKNLLKKKYPFYYQTNSMDCGLACLRMIVAYYGKKVSLERLRSLSDFEKSGVSMFGLQKAAVSLHLEATGVMATIPEIKRIVTEIPVILHWKGDHFILLFAYSKGHFVVADPAKGIMRLSEAEFSRYALYTGSNNGAMASLLLLESTDEFTKLQNDKANEQRHVQFFLSQISRFRRYYAYIVWALLLGLVVQFLLPFFTKNVVDLGIDSKSIKYVGYLLLGQFVLIMSSTFFTVVRSWITLHLSSRINYSLVAAFLDKLFRVPLNFFETRKIGDILQRISDHSRIEMFITRTALGVLFSIVSVILYSSILAYYHFGFFVLLFTTILLYTLWISIFLKRRKQIDWKRFEVSSKNQSNIIQIVNGIHDLKINSAEGKYYDKWSVNQSEAIKNSFDSLRLSQFQETGTTFIFQLSQIAITFLSVTLVINSRISFGTMLSIQFIIGQLIVPIQQIIGAITSAQDARLSFDRLFDVWNVKNESDYRKGEKVEAAEKTPPIIFNNLSFCYPGQENEFALNNVSLTIESGKTTAIVGLSGSGKTSILKLLLGYYSEFSGEIKIGTQNFKDISLDEWRSKCGVVMQESFIFNDTISENICMNRPFDLEKLKKALTVANIWGYVDSLPLKYNTVIGIDGKGLSQGQKQRLLIARAVYKDPEYVFFDEATNALDAENETIIINNLKEFFVGRTVVLIAHRLSTIQFADNIVLLQNGVIAENGDHTQLKNKRGKYFELIKKQMAI